MSGTPVGNLPDAVRDYVVNPTFKATSAVEAALVGMPPEAAEMIRSLLEMIVNLKGEVATERQLRTQLEELLAKAVGTTVTNIAQAGDKNAAQTGSGRQEISGGEQESPPLVADDALHILAAERADAVGGRGARVEPRTQFIETRGTQSRRPARVRRSCDGVEPVVAVHVDPALHEAAAAAEHLLDLSGLGALDGQNNGAKTIALLGIALYSRPAFQGVKISRVAFD